MNTAPGLRRLITLAAWITAAIIAGITASSGLPDNRSTAVAVTTFDTDPSTNIVSGVTGSGSSTLVTPWQA